MTIEDVLRQLGLADCRCNLDPDSDDGFPTYDVYVPRQRLDEANQKLLPLYTGNFFVRLHQVPPPLVPAEPGQFVRVYSKYETDDDKSPLGIVASKVKNGDKTVYGCRYVQIALANHFNSDIYPFHLTAENYGGYHDGFLKVVDPAEVPAILNAMIEDGHKKAVAKAGAMRDQALAGVRGFVNVLCKGRISHVERLEFDDMPPGVSVK